MSTKEDVKAIAERMALVALPGSGYGIQRAGFEHAANVLLPHILSLMGRVKHADDCESLEGPDYAPMGDNYVPVPHTEPPCSCGLDAELKSIESLIHQTT
mgnify:CR=1 FL=1